MIAPNPIDNDDDPSDRDGGGCNQSRAQIETLRRAGLTADELVVMSAVVADCERQREVATRLHRSQTWVHRRLRRAAAKLASLGVNVPLPRRGRRNGHGIKFVDPAAMGQLRVDQDRVAGQMKGTWSTGRRLRKRSDE